LSVGALAGAQAVVVEAQAVSCLGPSIYRPALFTLQLSALVAQKHHKRQ
jgi:hypothetical protein